MIVPYQPKHYPILVEWYQGWKLPVPMLEILPTTGFIAANQAACFLYETNSKVCFIDCLIRNPKLPSSQTTQALDQVVDHTIQYAIERGFRFMVGNSNKPFVVQRAYQHGFDQAQLYFYFVKDLTPRNPNA
jgi:hypothetical protein